MTVVMRGWGILAGVVMMIVMTTRFSKAEQGYYYTFASLIALQAFFELGLNFVLTQFVSHESARFTWNQLHRTFSGDRAALDRVALLYLSVRRWFLLSASLFALVVGAGGTWFLSRAASTSRPEGWVVAWLMLCITAAANLYYSPQLAIVEGLGRIGDVAWLRVRQSVVGYSLCWLAVFISPGLYVIAFMSLSAALMTAIWMKRESGLPALAALIENTTIAPRWKSEIFPLQWRIALSWMSGYLIYQLFTPMTFAHQGAEAAAKIGLSLSIFSNVAAISMSWMVAKTPLLGSLVASNQRSELHRIFIRLFMQSLTFHAIVCAGVLGAGALIIHYQMKIADRIVPFDELVALVGVSTVNLIIFSLATFMRVHKKEPMVTNSLACGTLIGILTYITSYRSTSWVIAGYLAVIAFVSLPWAYLLFKKFWNEYMEIGKPLR
jgi:hypothetical protein